MLNLLLVGAGGFLGSGARYLVGIGAERLSTAHSYPYGTLVVNVLGCLVIGLLAGILEMRPGLFTDELKVFVFVGLLGGFTTFSAFGLDTVQLLREHSIGIALANVAIQVGVGILGVWMGLEGVRVLTRG